MFKSTNKNLILLVALVALLMGAATVTNAQKKKVFHPKAQAVKKPANSVSNANKSSGPTFGKAQSTQTIQPNAQAIKQPNGALVKKQQTTVNSSSARSLSPSIIADNKEIIAYLKTQPDCTEYRFKVIQIEIGPNKPGYVGLCRVSSGLLNASDVDVLYEKTPNGLRRVFQVTIQWGTSLAITKKVNKGYYDIFAQQVAGSGVLFFLYRSNGSRYPAVPEQIDMHSTPPYNTLTPIIF